MQITLEIEHVLALVIAIIGGAFAVVHYVYKRLDRYVEKEQFSEVENLSKQNAQQLLWIVDNAKVENHLTGESITLREKAKLMTGRVVFKDSAQ